MPKIEPAVTTMWYSVADGISYIDLAKDLSAHNRRLYRQGMVYAVQDIQVALAPGMKVSDVWSGGLYTIPNTWPAHNAWSKGYAAWRKQQREILQALPGIQGTWADFKVYLDDSMEDGTILTPVAGDGAALAMGEWEHSKLVFDDDGTEREFKMHLIGSSNLTDTNNESGIGLIHEYQISRRRPQDPDPDVPADANNSIYAKLLGTDEMSDMLVDNIEGDNDSAPYDDVEYYGGASNGDAAHLQQLMSVSSTESTTRIPGFVAPCGLIKVATSESSLSTSGGNPPDGNSIYEAGTAPTVLLGVTVAVGPYRGVLATSMGQ